MTQQLQAASPTLLTAWVQLDYVSVTFPQAPITDNWKQTLAGITNAATNPHCAPFLHRALSSSTWIPGKGRKGQGASFHDEQSGSSVFYGGAHSVSVAEFPGGGCKMLRSFSGDREIASQARDTCTRIDVAIDVLCDITPMAVDAAGFSGKFATSSMAKSLTGQTLYIGSEKSERFVRVYRYHPPHPRAHLLRIEIVSRRKYAKAVCTAIAAQGLGAAAATLLDNLGLKHPELQVFAHSGAPITPLEARRDSSKRLSWILRQVTPALIDMHRKGEIDVRQWYEKHLEPVTD